MKLRVLTALILAPLAIALVLWPPTVVFASLIGALMLLGVWEWSRLSGIRSRPWRVLLLLPHAGLLVGLWQLGSGALAWAAWIGAGWWLLALLWLWRRRFAASDSGAHRALKLGAGLLMFPPAWAALVLLHQQPERGPVWALLAVMVVWAADTFAYFAGSRIGGPRLAPNISPGKTWAGFWGGLVGSLVIAAAGGLVLGLEAAALGWLLLLALPVFLASVLGDLFESLIKRHSGAKDSGHIIPGHGGALDRLDSLVAALPVFWCGKQLLGL
jgi:phosphatidate cytidylyltransferase